MGSQFFYHWGRKILWVASFPEGSLPILLVFFGCFSGYFFSSWFFCTPTDLQWSQRKTEAFDDFDINIELLDSNVNALDVGADAKSEVRDDLQLPEEVQTALHMLERPLQCGT